MGHYTASTPSLMSTNRAGKLIVGANESQMPPTEARATEGEPLVNFITFNDEKRPQTQHMRINYPKSNASQTPSMNRGIANINMKSTFGTHRGIKFEDLTKEIHMIFDGKFKVSSQRNLESQSP